MIIRTYMRLCEGPAWQHGNANSILVKEFAPAHAVGLALHAWQAWREPRNSAFVVARSPPSCELALDRLKRR